MERENPTGAVTSPGERAASTAEQPKDGVSAYVEKSLNVDALTEDIQKLVAARVQSSLPEEGRLMLELMARVDELTGEVRELRKQLDARPYAVFPCSGGQFRDLSGELSELRQLLQTERKPRRLSAAEETPADPATVFTEQLSPAPKTVVPQEPAPKKRRGAASVLGNLLFYLVLIGVVLGAILLKSGSGGPTVIAGYSAFTVLSSSMEDTYPKGALIVTRSVDADELKVGDDITYMVSPTSTVTHRIIGITEEYLDTGERAFETQGTMNETPDQEPVAAANVVGRVIFCSVLLGSIASFVTANWPLLIFFVVVLAALLAFLRWNLRRPEEPQEKKRRGAPA